MEFYKTAGRSFENNAEKCRIYGKEPHERVVMKFCCEKKEMGLYMHMLYLNRIAVSGVSAMEYGNRLSCELTLEGNVTKKI